MHMITERWIDKYSPKSVSEYIFQSDAQRTMVETIVKNKRFDNLLLYGHRGTGKTSLAMLIKNEIGIDDVDFLKINASLEKGIDTIRNKVFNFASTLSMSWEYKVILLDEGEALTPDAQRSLKSLMDDFGDSARFIITTNHVNRLISELRSRCLEIEYKAIDRDDMTIRFASILKKEKVKVDNIEFIDQLVESCYPDFRKLLINAQSSVKDGCLVPFGGSVSDTEGFMASVIPLIDGGDWSSARQVLSRNLTDADWQDCYRFLYDFLSEIGKFSDLGKWKKGIVTIAEHLHKHTTASDREINFASCLIKLSEI